MNEHRQNDSPAPRTRLEPRPPRASESVISELMMPNQVNGLGHVFGGVLLSMVDRVAAVAAMRHAGRPCVTASIDRVDFRQPIYAGELVTCRARVNYVGRTSLEVGVTAEAENLLTGTRRHTNSCYLTFVAIDEQHDPVPVPPLQPESDDDRRRMREGEIRRRNRLKLLEQLGETEDEG
jgi:acyl-CoA hydrolase